MSLLQGPPGFPPGIPFEVVLIVRSVMTTIAAIALGIPIIRALSRRFIERPPVQPGLPPEVLLRLERIEQAVDSIAIEVERVSEGQRYTTRLLSEGGGRASGGAGAPGGSSSPGDTRSSR
jgi:hypothetical protein